MSLKSLLLIASLFVASSLQATPLTWHFSGTVASGSTYNGDSIEGLQFELRIFLDTSVVGKPNEPGSQEITFRGPFEAEVTLVSLPADKRFTVPVDMFSGVQYFGRPHVKDVILLGPPRSEVDFSSSISSTPLHLGPIHPTEGFVSGGRPLAFEGPNDLSVISDDTVTFSATEVPEAGSTLLFLGLGLMAVEGLRRKIATGKNRYT